MISFCLGSSTDSASTKITTKRISEVDKISKTVDLHWRVSGCTCSIAKLSPAVIAPALHSALRK
jgi:hypothetical protein